MATCVASVRIPQEVKTTIDEIAKSQNRKPSWIMARMLEQSASSLQEEINFIKERAKLAEEDKKAGQLIDADVAIANLNQYIEELD